MGETTKIQWTDATVNFWHGCKKVSEGCKFCYMYRDKEKYGQKGEDIKLTKPGTITGTLRKLYVQQEERLAAGITQPLKIFTCSWSDFFLEEADPWREEAWDRIREHNDFIWIILTKRPERILQCLPEDWGEGWPHVWLLVSAENQERWDERVPILLNVPARVRGVSAEPLLGPINIRGGGIITYPTERTIENKDLDWIIIGGESGNDTGKWLYRKSLPEWYTNIVEAAYKAGVPVFMKQLGTYIAKVEKLKDRSGGNQDEWPLKFHHLKLHQFPYQQ